MEVRERGFASQRVAEGFDLAVAFAFAGPNRIFVAEKKGTVRVVQGGQLLAAPFVDLSAEVNTANDRGLVGIAVHPEFPAQPYVYVVYVYDPPELSSLSPASAPDGTGARASRLVRFEADPASDYTLALPGSALVLLGKNSALENMGNSDARNDYERPACGVRGAYVRDCLPADENSHVVGNVTFGPDGALYVGNGDGCDYTAAQPVCTRAIDLGSLAGKILRIDPLTGHGLADNPFADPDDLESNRSKIYQLGLRNPFRFTFDRLTHALYVGDVGWNVWEEINRAGPGANFGWPCFEGGNAVAIEQPSYRDYPRCVELAMSGRPITPALFAYTHDGLPGEGSAVLVGDMYRGASYPPLYRGALFYADFNRKQLRFLSFAADGSVASSQVFSDGIGYVTQMTTEPSTHDLFVLQLGSTPDGVLSKLDRIVFAGYGPGPAPDALYELVSSADERCVEAESPLGPAASGATLRYCTPDAAQRFRLESAGDELYRISSESVGFALTMNARGEGRAEVTLSPWENLPSQRFRFFALTGGYQLIDEENELCLALREEDGTARLVGARCAMTPTQLFRALSEANRDPVIEPVATQTGVVGGRAELQLIASDPEGKELTFFATGLPPGLSIDPQRGFVLGEYAQPGSYGVRIRVTDGERSASLSFTWNVQDDKLPNVVIAEPVEGTFYVPGQKIGFHGSASDYLGQAIDPSKLSWELMTHHNQHIHVGGLPVTLGEGGQFLADDHGDNTSLELCLIALDGENRSGRACRVLLPQKVEYTIDSEPSGVIIPWEGVPHATPFTVETNVGGKRTLNAPLQSDGWPFARWSDGGGAYHVITIGSEPLRLVATYATPERGESPAYESAPEEPATIATPASEQLASDD